MRYRDAKKLHNRDEVEVCISRKSPAEWAKGHVLGVPLAREDGGGRKVVEVTVDTKEHGLLFSIPHTAIR